MEKLQETVSENSSSHGKVKLLVGVIAVLVVLALFYFFAGGGDFFQGNIGKIKSNNKQEMQGLIPTPVGFDVGPVGKSSIKQGSKQEMQGLIPTPVGFDAGPVGKSSTK